MLAVPHFAEDAQILLNRTIAVGRVLSRFLERATVVAHFVRRLLVDIGIARLDEVFGKGVHVLKVRAREIEVLLAPVLPGEAKPANAVENAVDVLLILLHGIGVVEAHVAAAAVIAGKAEVEADALRVADVKVAVRLRRETRADFRRIGLALLELLGIGSRIAAPIARLIGAFSQILFDDVANEVGCTPGLGFRVVAHRVS